MFKVKTFKSSIFRDHRGFYWTSWKKKKHKLNYNHDKFSISKKNTLRGLHGDTKTWKLVSCTLGEFFIAIVNLDKSSKNYLKYDTFTLNSSNKVAILVPPLHGIGHCITADMAVYYYKQTSYYEDKDEFVFPWNSDKLNINWPVKNPILSLKDSQ